MKNQNIFLVCLAIVVSLSITLFSCKKPVDDFPKSDEAISFLGIDSTTVKVRAGEDLLVDVVLITDTIIDTLRIGYLIDTLGITTNITYNDILTETIITGFPEVNNKYVYSATIKMPANAYGVRPFRPFRDNIGDFVRVIFRMEAGSRSYEKQLKLIIEP